MMIDNHDAMMDDKRYRKMISMKTKMMMMKTIDVLVDYVKLI